MKCLRRGRWRSVLSIALAGVVMASAMTFSASPAALPPDKSDARDWKAHPAVVEVKATPEIYALGDMHGDYEKAAALLAGAGLIRGTPAKPQDVQWAGGKNVLVCTGDMIDKWDEGLAVVRMMRALESSAEHAGGQVVVTLGNHEAEFLGSGGLNKKGSEFEKELRAAGIAPEDVAAGKDSEGIGLWLRNRPVAVKIDDWFFCHAGNTLGMTVKELEGAVESGVNKDGFGAFVLAEPNSILEARMSGVPWWMMAPATQSATPAAETEPRKSGGLARLRSYVEALGCKHLVVGHQPGKVQFGGSVERKAGEPFAYEGVLFLTDTGMSRGAQDGRGVILKIETEGKEGVRVLDAVGRSSVLWEAK